MSRPISPIYHRINVLGDANSHTAHTPHSSHMPRPISPICHAPFLPYVTPHFSHMSRPISPICHAPFLPYISPNTYVRRHLLFRQERRVGGRPSDARCRAALSFGGLIECDQVPFSLTHAPFFPICHTPHASHISPRFVFCVFVCFSLTRPILPRWHTPILLYI